MHQNSRDGIQRRGGVASPNGLGNPTPTDLTSRFPLYPCNPLIRVIGDSDKWHMSPLWGFKIFVCRACYKHAAPLGLKAPMHQNSRDGIQRRGGVASPNGLGNPTPTDLTSRFSLYPCNPLICRIGDSDKEDMSPLWGFKIFVYRVCYKHVAPLGLKAPMHQNSRDGIQRRGEVTSADGLGNPTPTDSTFPFFALSVQSFNPCNR